MGTTMTDRRAALRSTEVAQLAEQQGYYNARAPEYDHWWHRQGRYDLGEKGNRGWWQEVGEVRRLLDERPLTGDVLELAAGTGTWTKYLARRATRLTVLDGSAEMLALNRKRLTEAGVIERVTYGQESLLPFRPRPGATYDAVFFSFWLSHVPATLVDDFLAAVSASLRPGGWLAVLDNRPGGIDRSRQGTERLDENHERRQLEDGRRFEVVKRLDEPAQLVARLDRVGITASVHMTEQHFVVATGQRRNLAGEI